MKKLLLASALTSSLILAGCGNSADTVANDAISNATSAVSGTITDDSNTTANTPLPGVNVECIYTGSLPCSSSTTDTSGNYSVTLLNNTDFYLRAALSSYITVNSAVKTVSANNAGNDVALLKISDAETLINSAFSPLTGLTMSSAAWLVVDVADATTGNRIAGQVVNPSPAGDADVYPDCATMQPVSPVATATTACTAGNDNAPAYMAKYSTTGEVTVTVGSQTQRGFLVNGEVLYMEFEQ